MDEEKDYEFLKARYDILWEIARHYRQPSNWQLYEVLEDCRVYAFHEDPSGNAIKGYDFAKEGLDRIWDMETERGRH